MSRTREGFLPCLRSHLCKRFKSCAWQQKALLATLPQASFSGQGLHLLAAHSISLSYIDIFAPYRTANVHPERHQLRSVIQGARGPLHGALAMACGVR